MPPGLTVHCMQVLLSYSNFFLSNITITTERINNMPLGIKRKIRNVIRSRIGASSASKIAGSRVNFNKNKQKKRKISRFTW